MPLAKERKLPDAGHHADDWLDPAANSATMESVIKGLVVGEAMEGDLAGSVGLTRKCIMWIDHLCKVACRGRLCKLKVTSAEDPSTKQWLLDHLVGYAGVIYLCMGDCCHTALPSRKVVR